VKDIRQQGPYEQHSQNEDEEGSLTLKTVSAVARQNASAFALQTHCCVTALKVAFVRDTVHFLMGILNFLLLDQGSNLELSAAHRHVSASAGFS